MSNFLEQLFNYSIAVPSRPQKPQAPKAEEKRAPRNVIRAKAPPPSDKEQSSNAVTAPAKDSFFTREKVVSGVIMAEVLGRPVSKRRGRGRFGL